jgi:hypothetical protein
MRIQEAQKHTDPDLDADPDLEPVPVVSHEMMGLVKK